MKPLESILEEVTKYQDILTILQKNSNLAHYGSFNKSLLKLSENQTEMARLTALLKKDTDQIMVNRENLKMNLLLQYQHLGGVLNLIEGRNFKKKFFNINPKKTEKLKGSELLKQAQKAIMRANKLGGFSVISLNDISNKALNETFNKSKKIAEEFGLTSEKVKRLEEACLSFMKASVEASCIHKEQKKIIKSIIRKLDQNARIYKNRIDKFVQVYEKPGSNFLKAYKAYRPDKEDTKIQKEQVNNQLN